MNNNDIQSFFEEYLRFEEVTALEVYDSVYKNKLPLSAKSYLKILENDPTAIIGIGTDTENILG